MLKYLTIVSVLGLTACATFTRTEVIDPYIILNHNGYPYVFATIQNVRTGIKSEGVFLGRHCKLDSVPKNQIYHLKSITYTDISNSNNISVSFEPDSLKTMCPN